MRRPYTVEAEYSYSGKQHPDCPTRHRTRSFGGIGAAWDYARWARNRATFEWAIVYHKGTPLALWANGAVRWISPDASKVRKEDYDAKQKGEA